MTSTSSLVAAKKRRICRHTLNNNSDDFTERSFSDPSSWEETLQISSREKCVWIRRDRRQQRKEKLRESEKFSKSKFKSFIFCTRRASRQTQSSVKWHTSRRKKEMKMREKNSFPTSWNSPKISCATMTLGRLQLSPAPKRHITSRVRIYDDGRANHYRLSSLSSSSHKKIKCTQIDITISRTPPTYPHITFQLFSFCFFVDEPHNFFSFSHITFFNVICHTPHDETREKFHRKKLVRNRGAKFQFHLSPQLFTSSLLLYYSFSTPRE